MAVAVAPGAELLHDPGEQPGRRVVERDAERLRLGRLLERVAGLLALELLHGGEIRLVLVGERAPGPSGGSAIGMLRWMRRAVLRIERADPRRDLRAPVAALRAVARVAEAVHQLDERPRDAPHVPAARARGLREAVARAATGATTWNASAALAAVRLRVGQPRDDVEELDDRAGPAVREEQRQRVRVRRARVDEVDRLAVDARAEVLELVEPRLLRAPVVLVAPVLDQLAQVVDRDPVLPARALDLVREAGPRQPAAQVVEDRVVDADLEPLDRRRSWRGRHAASPTPASLDALLRSRDTRYARSR